MAADGTHTSSAVDLLAESRAAVAGGSSAVLVVQSTDVGKRSSGPDGRPCWVTLVDEGSASSDEVTS